MSSSEFNKASKELKRDVFKFAAAAIAKGPTSEEDLVHLSDWAFQTLISAALVQSVLDGQLIPVWNTDKGAPTFENRPVKPVPVPDDPVPGPRRKRSKSAQ